MAKGNVKKVPDYFFSFLLKAWCKHRCCLFSPGYKKKILCVLKKVLKKRFLRKINQSNVLCKFYFHFYFYLSIYLLTDWFFIYVLHQRIFCDIFQPVSINCNYLLLAYSGKGFRKFFYRSIYSY